MLVTNKVPNFLSVFVVAVIWLEIFILSEKHLLSSGQCLTLEIKELVRKQCSAVMPVQFKAIAEKKIEKIEKKKQR